MTSSFESSRQLPSGCVRHLRGAFRLEAVQEERVCRIAGMHELYEQQTAVSVHLLREPAPAGYVLRLVQPKMVGGRAPGRVLTLAEPVMIIPAPPRALSHEVLERRLAHRAVGILKVHAHRRQRYSVFAVLEPILIRCEDGPLLALSILPSRLKMPYMTPRPPSTVMSVPLMYSPSLEAKSSATLAMSSGTPTRLQGKISANFSKWLS